MQREKMTGYLDSKKCSSCRSERLKGQSFIDIFLKIGDPNRDIAPQVRILWIAHTLPIFLLKDLQWQRRLGTKNTSNAQWQVGRYVSLYDAINVFSSCKVIYLSQTVFVCLRSRRDETRRDETRQKGMFKQSKRNENDQKVFALIRRLQLYLEEEITKSENYFFVQEKYL